MIRATAGLLAAIAALVALVAWWATRHFSSDHTRLTAIPQSQAAASRLPPAPKHVVVIVEENKDFSQITGNTREAPYLNELIARGALFTRSYGVAHPSQPNYLALFAGVADTNGDGCPPAGIDASAQNLATELTNAHRSFAGYAEDLPSAGSRICSTDDYARKHVPWADFTNVTPAENLPLRALPRRYDKLPTVAFIIPNLLDDMHSASIERGDAWLRKNASPLIRWAFSHDTLVLITWDESDSESSNHIPTIAVGPMVRAGRYSQAISHYGILRTIEDLYRLPPLGGSAHAAPISAIWTKA